MAAAFTPHRLPGDQALQVTTHQRVRPHARGCVVEHLLLRRGAGLDPSHRAVPQRVRPDAHGAERHEMSDPPPGVLRTGEHPGADRAELPCHPALSSCEGGDRQDHARPGGEAEQRVGPGGVREVLRRGVTLADPLHHHGRHQPDGHADRQPFEPPVGTEGLVDAVGEETSSGQERRPETRDTQPPPCLPAERPELRLVRAVAHQRHESHADGHGCQVEEQGRRPSPLIVAPRVGERQHRRHGRPCRLDSVLGDDREQEVRTRGEPGDEPLVLPGALRQRPREGRRGDRGCDHDPDLLTATDDLGPDHDASLSCLRVLSLRT